jgi:hypothetical protein
MTNVIKILAVIATLAVGAAATAAQAGPDVNLKGGAGAPLYPDFTPKGR